MDNDFILRKGDYSVKKFLKVILSTCLVLGSTAPLLAQSSSSGSSSQSDSLVTEFTSEQQFQETIGGSYSTPLIVDFYSPYCGPCKVLVPELEKMAQQYQGKVRVMKLNVSKFGRIATSYGVSAVPTLILFDKKGNVKQVGIGQGELYSLFENLD